MSDMTIYDNARFFGHWGQGGFISVMRQGRDLKIEVRGMTPQGRAWSSAFTGAVVDDTSAAASTSDGGDVTLSVELSMVSAEQLDGTLVGTVGGTPVAADFSAQLGPYDSLDQYIGAQRRSNYAVFGTAGLLGVALVGIGVRNYFQRRPEQEMTEQKMPKGKVTPPSKIKNNKKSIFDFFR